jgi:hypothetical protein
MMKPRRRASYITNCVAFYIPHYVFLPMSWSPVSATMDAGPDESWGNPVMGLDDIPGAIQLGHVRGSPNRTRFGR